MPEKPKKIEYPRPDKGAGLDSEGRPVRPHRPQKKSTEKPKDKRTDKEKAKEQIDNLREGKRVTLVERRITSVESDIQKSITNLQSSAGKNQDLAKALGVDQVTDNPLVADVANEILNAAPELQNDPNYLIMKGIEVSRGRGGMTTKAYAEKKQMLQKIADKVSDLASDLGQAEAYEGIVQKHLLEGAGGGGAGDGGGKEPPIDAPSEPPEDSDRRQRSEVPEFKLIEKPEDLASLKGKELDDLRETLEGMNRVFETDVLKKSDTRWIQKQIEELDKFVAKSREHYRSAQPFIEKLEDHLGFLQETNAELFGKVGDWEKAKAKAASLQQQLNEARHKLVESVGFPEGDEQNFRELSKISNSELRLLLSQASVSWNSTGTLGTIQDGLRSLLDKSHLSGEDVAIAGNLSEYLSTKMQLMSYVESIYPNAHERDLQRFFYGIDYTREDVNFIFNQMSRAIGTDKNPGLFQFLGVTNGRFDAKRWSEFSREVDRTFNFMFKQVNETPSEAWEEWFTLFYHKPVYQAFANRLSRLREDLREINKISPDQIPTCRILINGKEQDVKLNVLVENLHHTIRAQYNVQEYTHNAFYILKARLDLKALSGFANKLSSDEIDLVFANSRVQVAYGFFEQILRHELGWNQQMVDQTWFQIQVDAMNKKGYSEKISDRVETLLDHHFPDLEEWEKLKVISIARGAVFGVSAEGLTLLGEADPPRDIWRIRGYFADRILYVLNPTRHFYNRWWIRKASEEVPLLYTEVRKGGTMEGWDPSQLDANMKRYGHERLTNLRQYKNTVRPFIHLSNVFQIGSLGSRDGWRDTSLATKIFEQLPRDPDTDWVDYKKLTLNDHLIPTKEKLEKAGINFVFDWAKELEGKIPEHILEKAGLTKRQVLEALLKKDPLFFIDKDSTLWNPKNFRSEDNPGGLGFRDTIRGKALLKLGKEWEGPVNTLVDPIGSNTESLVNKLRDDMGLDRFEEILMEATAVMRGLREPEWNARVTQELAKSVRPAELKLAFGYYKAIQDVVLNDTTMVTYKNQPATRDKGKKSIEKLQETGKVSKDLAFEERTDSMTFIEEFAMRDYPNGIGDTTMNWNDVRLAEAGQDVVARNFDDWNKIGEEVIGPALYFDNQLRQMNEKKDFTSLDEYFHKARAGVEYVNGKKDAFYEWSYLLNLMKLRYPQKAWWARLPVGIGTAAGFLSPKLTGKFAAFSQKLTESTLTWATDEQRTWMEIHRLVDMGMLSPEYGEMLREEVGGRTKQMVFDVIRSYAPWVLGLAAVAGVIKGTKDQEDK